MRIIQTVNDTIRLLFNPKTEIFRLSDFLLVRDGEENFLGQVIEVYDDKFDQESNVAKIKLIFKIVNGNEIVPYDNYTPSRECEVARIQQAEIEKCINLNKETIAIGKNAFSKEEMSLNTGFFTNNCAIFADRFEETNQIFENLAPRLSAYKNVLVIDCSGSCNIEGASVFTAGNTFRMPLSSKTIDYIQQKTLFRAKLETQVVLGDVFEEVKNFLSSSEEDYIPYQKFIKVIQSECKKTPSVELLVLISWLKKYAREGIFAKNKREYENLFKSIEKNKVSVLDLSNIKAEWQKEHVDYITEQIKSGTFVLIRLNDNNINNDILNSVYLKRKNVIFVPSFAYGYKKVPYIMEFAQNCILMPTLNPKRDFAYANFQVQCLNKDNIMLFGEDTCNFIFVLENEPSSGRAIRKNQDAGEKVYISLNLQLEDMTPLELMPDNFEVKPVETKRKRLENEIKLSDVINSTTDTRDTVQAEIQEEDTEEIADVENEDAPVLESEELDYFEQAQDVEVEETAEAAPAEEADVPVETGEGEVNEDIQDAEDDENTTTLPEEIEETSEVKSEVPAVEVADEDIEGAGDDTENEEPADEENSEEINRQFDKILNEEEVKKEGETLKIDEKVSIDLERIKKEAKTNEKKLPIFNDDDDGEEAVPVNFSEGEKISHPSYGEGEILKVIKYGARCLLQIEFPKVGKRLLDPKIAKLKPVEAEQ